VNPAVDSSEFEIRQCLGAGGFGEVYLAATSDYGEVALKVLHNGLDPRSQAVQRLRDEARLLGLLDHPSILSIHDLIVLDDRVALVTEYVDGQDLEHLLVARPAIDIPAGLDVLAAVASALQSAYTTIGPRGTQLGLLHRDIKPGNIRVGRDGSVKLLDFGIAKATGVTREAKTRTSGVLGSFAYMAPERFDPKQTDTPAGDVCSIGCVLFELLSGGEMLFGEYDIKDLFGLALMPERRVEALEQRLGTLQISPNLMELLRDLLAYDPVDRPPLAGLPDRLDGLAAQVEGQRLRPWANSYRWPEVDSMPGGLSGKKLVGTSLGHSPVLGAAPKSRVDTTLPVPIEVPTSVAEPREVPPPPGFRWGWLGASAVTVLMLSVGAGVLGAVGVGLILASRSESAAPVASPTPVAAPTPVEKPSPVATPTPVEKPAPAPENPPNPNAPAVPPVPVPVPEPASASTLSSGSGADRCGVLVDFEPAAVLGRLPPDVHACIAELMVDPRVKQTGRDRAGRIVLADALAKCSKSSDCSAYERLQRHFFLEVTQSDADMLATFAEHLYSTSNNRVERLVEADLWARRALERRDQWSGRKYTDRVKRMNEIRARAAYQRFSLEPSPARRLDAVERAADWAELLRRLNLDATAAMELCASAAGSADRCDRRVTTEAVLESIRFISRPFGATVRVDGLQVGETPVLVPLTHGSHLVKISVDGVESTHRIEVGGGEATQWSWTQSTDTWKSVHQ